MRRPTSAAKAVRHSIHGNFPGLMGCQGMSSRPSLRHDSGFSAFRHESAYSMHVLGGFHSNVQWRKLKLKAKLDISSSYVTVKRCNQAL